MDRLQQFKELVARLNPMRPVREPHEHAWYVQRPDSLAHRIARSFDLEPTASHLIIGSIGCGKSTELLAVGRELASTAGICPDYVEVSDLGEAGWAAQWERLVAALGAELAAGLYTRSGSADAEAEELFADFAHLVKSHRDGDEDTVFRTVRDGADFGLAETSDDADGQWQQYQSLIIHVARVARRVHQAELVCLVDGLDRIDNPSEFEALTGPLVRLFRQAGIGIVAVAPRKVVVGVDLLGAPSDFEERHAVPPVDPTSGGAGHSFLRDVVQRRDVDRLLAEPAVDELVQRSGGVVRILLQLTRQAAKDAYARDAARVGVEHVRAAVERLGHSMLLGLDSGDLQLLDQVGRDGVFAARDDHAWALVRANKIVEYFEPTGVRTYRVHPALHPFLPALREQFERERQRAKRAPTEEIPF